MAQILLLEPDKLLAQAYRGSLEAAGHQVYWQRDAAAALPVLDDHPIELVVLELQLAKHNGVELLYEMRSYPDWDHIPVLLHTMVPPTHTGLGRAFWDELGVVEYRYKPQTSLKQLVQSVNRQLAVAA